MTQQHNKLRREHGVKELAYNPLIAANMQRYLEKQDTHQNCMMAHSPRQERNPVGDTYSP